jgi:hypothetical protein
MNNKKTIPLDYVNGLMYELEKAFWDERGRGARFRMTTVGGNIIDRVRPLLQSNELEHTKTVQSPDTILMGLRTILMVAY